MWYIVSYSREMSGGRRIYVQGIRITKESLLGMMSVISGWNYIIHSAVLETSQEEIDKCWKMYDGTDQAKLQKERSLLK
jgi:hypothetical protein